MAWRSRARVSASPVVKTTVKVVWSRKSWRWYRRSGLVSSLMWSLPSSSVKVLFDIAKFSIIPEMLKWDNFLRTGI